MTRTLRILFAAVFLAVQAAAQDGNTFPCPCFNGGQCLRIAGTTRTTCYCNQNPQYGKTYRGDRCQAESTECPGDMFCVNGGKCVHYQGQNTVFCQCPAGSSGIHCQYIQPKTVKTQSVQKLAAPVQQVKAAPEPQASKAQVEEEAAIAIATAAAPDSVDTLPNDGTTADIAAAADKANVATAPAAAESAAVAAAQEAAAAATTAAEAAQQTVASGGGGGGSKVPVWTIIVIAVLGGLMLTALVALALVVGRERAGRPVFFQTSGFQQFSDKAAPMSSQQGFYGTQDRLSRLEAIVSEIAGSFGTNEKDKPARFA